HGLLLRVLGRHGGHALADERGNRHDDQQQAWNSELEARNLNDVGLAETWQPQEWALEGNVLELGRLDVGHLHQRGVVGHNRLGRIRIGARSVHPDLDHVRLTWGGRYVAFKRAVLIPDTGADKNRRRAGGRTGRIRVAWRLSR